MKKFFKWLFIIIATIYGILWCLDKFDRRPIRFFDYKNDGDLNSYLQNKFPVGSNVDEAITQMNKSGATCENRTKHSVLATDLNKYDLVYTCEYTSNLFTLHLIRNYRIFVIGDKDGKLIEISGGITKLMS